VGAFGSRHEGRGRHTGRHVKSDPAADALAGAAAGIGRAGRRQPGPRQPAPPRASVGRGGGPTPGRLVGCRETLSSCSGCPRTRPWNRSKRRGGALPDSTIRTSRAATRPWSGAPPGRWRRSTPRIRSCAIPRNDGCIGTLLRERHMSEGVCRAVVARPATVARVVRPRALPVAPDGFRGTAQSDR
jgi:hypothetical protein